VINPIHDAAELHEEYRLAEPFPHIALDNFFEPKVAEEIVAELDACDTDSWFRDDHPEQVNKRWMDRPDQLPSVTGAALRYLNSEAACGFFSGLTGIHDLLPDPAYLGGGVHVSFRGGRLGVHADFNLHPQSGLHRRVNALIFLNKNWDPAWRGQLELWSKDASKPVVSINPEFNRMVAFNITDEAFHGVPSSIDCPPNRKRFSLALYYYTTERPQEEKAPFHWAAWQHVQEPQRPPAGPGEVVQRSL
jgi:hypothetical protein